MFCPTGSLVSREGVCSGAQNPSVAGPPDGMRLYPPPRHDTKSLTAPQRCPSSLVITFSTNHFATIHLNPQWRTNTSGRDVSVWSCSYNKGMSKADTAERLARSESLHLEAVAHLNNIYKHPVPTAQKTQYVSITKLRVGAASAERKCKCMCVT